jgi:hypothetical protein
VYDGDGFAVNFPYPPNIHPDPQTPSTTVYTVGFEGGVVSFRVIKQDRDCNNTLGLLKNGALAGQQPGIEKSSIIDSPVSGYPALAYRFKADANRTTYQRFVCVNGTFYAFSVGWPTAREMPAAATRIVDSLRFLPPHPRTSTQNQASPVIQDEKRPNAGSLVGGQYKNDFFGFTYTLPANFRPAALPAMASRSMDGQNSFALLVVGDSVHPSTATKASGVVKITAYRASSLWGSAWPQKNGEDYLRKLRTMMFNVEAVGPIRQRDIAGHKFYELNGKTNPMVPMPQGVQKNVVIVERGFVLSFILEAGSQHELDDLDRSLESIAF